MLLFEFTRARARTPTPTPVHMHGCLRTHYLHSAACIINVNGSYRLLHRYSQVQVCRISINRTKAATACTNVREIVHRDLTHGMHNAPASLFDEPVQRTAPLSRPFIGSPVLLLCTRRGLIYFQSCYTLALTRYFDRSGCEWDIRWWIPRVSPRCTRANGNLAFNGNVDSFCEALRTIESGVSPRARLRTGE